MLGAGYRWLADSRFTRPAACVHLAGALTTICGLWAAADHLLALWKDHHRG